MKIYFLSSIPCALYIGGAYFGVVSSFERFAEISLADNLPVQFVPENALPISLFLSESVRFSPPENCEVYLLEDGLALYAKDFQSVDFTFRPIAQNREGNTLATVFSQGGVTLNVQTEEGSFTSPLPPCFRECTISFHGGCILLSTPSEIAVFSTRAELFLQESVLSFSVENDTLTATLPLSDRYQRTAKCVYSLSETGVWQTEYSLLQGESVEKETLLPYAFFESVRIGAEYREFLAPSLQEKASILTEFLGEFLYVLPTENPLVCKLVYKKSPRLFEVKSFTATVEDGLITDIQG